LNTLLEGFAWWVVDRGDDAEHRHTDRYWPLATRSQMRFGNISMRAIRHVVDA